MNVDALTVTVLVDDMASRYGVAGEHGLALLIESEGERLLYDTGQTGLFLANAKALGLELGGLRAAVLSHGHYDHIGGLAPLLDATGPLDVYAHPDALLPKRLRRGNAHPIAEAFVPKATYEERGARFHLGVAPQTIGDRFIVSGAVPREHGPQNTIPAVEVQRGQDWETDTIAEDLFVLARTSDGWALFTGCAHAGLENILVAATSLAAPLKLTALVGGFHLGGYEKDALEGVLDTVARHDLSLIAPMHCTGLRARVAFLERFGDKVVLPGTGDRLHLA